MKLSAKRMQIDKASTQIVAVVSVAAFLTVFSIFASKALLSKHSYQSRVIKAKQDADKILVDDLAASDSIVSAYKSFIQQPNNVIGGVSTGQSDRDGDNGKIVLDALPSQYDFPALATSLEKLLSSGGTYKIVSISGTDDNVNQQNTSPNPAPIPMPFELVVTSNYADAQSLISVFDKSIRPFQVQSLELAGGVDNIKMDLKAQTYYQPEKNLSTTTEVIK